MNLTKLELGKENKVVETHYICLLVIMRNKTHVMRLYE